MSQGEFSIEKSEKRGLGDRLRGFASHCSPGFKSHGSSQRFVALFFKYPPEQRACYSKEGGHPHPFVLRAFICLLQAGILGEVSREGLSRIFLSRPGEFFNTDVQK